MIDQQLYLIDPVKGKKVPAFGYDGSLLINSIRHPWREDFPGNALDSARWDILSQGAGQTITVTESELQITTGTTNGEEVVIRSKVPFTIPFRVWFIFWLSQRIANQEFYFEVVNAAGDMVARWKFDGTTATTGKYTTGNANTFAADASNTIISTANYAIAEIELYTDECYFASRAANSSNGKAHTYVRSRLLPDPTQDYYICIRAKNTGVAASSTTLYVDAVVVLDTTEVTAEITGGRGGGANSQMIPVNVNIGNMQDVMTAHTDSTTSLGAGATFTGTTRDFGATLRTNKIRARAYADQAGTLYIDQSRDSATWRSTMSIALAAGDVKMIEEAVVARYVRVRYVNGGTAQGDFELISVTCGIGAA